MEIVSFYTKNQKYSGVSFRNILIMCTFVAIYKASMHDGIDVLDVSQNNKFF